MQTEDSACPSDEKKTETTDARAFQRLCWACYTGKSELILRAFAAYSAVATRRSAKSYEQCLIARSVPSV
jgi:hypothetical protein